ncbi:MAG: hypothetical protein HWD58_10780 [Bacteroidota bacterium]|nr:MAG: hypothetical protein HWD58_10780 [Bacteroidota bacterium]
MGPKLVLLGLIGHLLCISARAQLYVSPNAVLHLQDASIVVQEEILNYTRRCLEADKEALC